MEIEDLVTLNKIFNLLKDSYIQDFARKNNISIKKASNLVKSIAIINDKIENSF